LTPRFLWYALQSRSAQDAIRNGATRSTQPNISMPDIAALRLVIPPLPEQERICRLLDVQMEKVESLSIRLTSQIRLLVEHRQALVTAAVTGDLDVSGMAA
jgi:type I restriction enzyme, S subunit